MFLEKSWGELLALRKKNLSKKAKLHGDASCLEVINHFVNSLINWRPFLGIIRWYYLIMNAARYLQITSLFLKKKSLMLLNEPKSLWARFSSLSLYLPLSLNRECVVIQGFPLKRRAGISSKKFMQSGTPTTCLNFIQHCFRNAIFLLRSK